MPRGTRVSGISSVIGRGVAVPPVTPKASRASYAALRAAHYGLATFGGGRAGAGHSVRCASYLFIFNNPPKACVVGLAGRRVPWCWPIGCASARPMRLPISREGMRGGHCRPSCPLVLAVRLRLRTAHAVGHQPRKHAW